MLRFGSGAVHLMQSLRWNSRPTASADQPKSSPSYCVFWIHCNSTLSHVSALAELLLLDRIACTWQTRNLTVRVYTSVWLHRPTVGHIHINCFATLIKTWKWSDRLRANMCASQIFGRVDLRTKQLHGTSHLTPCSTFATLISIRSNNATPLSISLVTNPIPSPRYFVPSPRVGHGSVFYWPSLNWPVMHATRPALITF